MLRRALQSALVIASLFASFVFIIAPESTGAQGAPMTLFDAYSANQAAAQAAGKVYEGQQPLDYTPFAAALDALPPGRIAALDAAVQGTPLRLIQALLASGETTSTELTTYYIERIRRIDGGRYNTVLELNPDALAIAAALDAERAAGRLRGPLHGIPILIKGNIATGDSMHTTAGAYVLRDAYADRDAFLAAQIRAAGMVILGKSNLSEWSNFYALRSINGFSVLGGFTRSPHGQFDVGGSSSGSCAAVALGFAPVSIGSETTGSITYPASQNGVVGLKPSVGLLSRDRIIPISDAFDTAGPIGRTVTDVAQLMTALAAQRDESDAASAEAARQIGTNFALELSEEALQGVRVGMVLYAEPLREGDSLIRKQVVEQLQAAGATVIDIPPMSEFAGKENDERLSQDSHTVMVRGYRLGVEAYLAAQGDRVPVQTLAEIVAFNADDPANRVPFDQELIVASSQVTEEQLAGYPELAARTKAEYARYIDSALAQHDVAFMADFSNYASPYHSRSGYPALTIPAGRRASGEPLGITFFAGWLSDADLLRWGYAFEQAASL